MAHLWLEVCLPQELYFLWIIFLVCVLPLVKQINHLLTPCQLVICSDLWTFIITFVLSRKSSCNPSGLALCLSSKALNICTVLLDLQSTFLYFIPFDSNKSLWDRWLYFNFTVQKWKLREVMFRARIWTASMTDAICFLLFPSSSSQDFWICILPRVCLHFFQEVRGNLPVEGSCSHFPSLSPRPLAWPLYLQWTAHAGAAEHLSARWEGTEPGGRLYALPTARAHFIF